MTAQETSSWVKMTVSDGRQEITSQNIYKARVKMKYRIMTQKKKKYSDYYKGWGESKKTVEQTGKQI